MSDVTIATATARDERPVIFPAGDEEIFGILTRPTTASNGICVVHLAGKGPSIATVSRGRMSVLLSRLLAARGYHSFRTEYRGTGDSTGADWTWSITEPELGEVRGALSWLEDQGLTRTVLVGTCGGARYALEMARHNPGTEAVVLLLPPMRDTEPWRRYDTLPTRHLLKRLLKRRHLAALFNRGRRKMYLARARSDILEGRSDRRARNRRGEGPSTDGRYQWIGPNALHGLEELTARGTRVLLYFGTDDNDYKDWLEACAGPVGPVLERAGDLIRVETVDGRYYDNPTREVAPMIVEAIARAVPGAEAGNGAAP